ncbi:hypothetical protein BCY86_06635 [Pajaroellobacter abortibovis]|uniref:Probable endonuclease 4 n=2 Tax=Pajaroellobacter abortibovis TaxID=1882918 RepID=A0A1L6MY11_9BACT|nr:hypothetical protein BCY86_06635 [Pajaroellobacter abortibovis]
MLFGAHESIEGGVVCALERGRVDACQAIQLFTKNSNSWREPSLGEKKIALFRSEHKKMGALPLLTHANYLINLAAQKEDVWERSQKALIAEMIRSEALGIHFVVLHPGAHMGLGIQAGVARVAAALNQIEGHVTCLNVRLLLENTAGQGTCLGHRFEELAQILERVSWRDRIGICFDTQHAFAAGYDLSTAEGYQATFDEFNRVVGLASLCAFHLNDSKKPLGSRVDRHENIGKGHLGLPLFWRLGRDDRFNHLPAVLETAPRDPNIPFKKEISLLNSLQREESIPSLAPHPLF